MPTPSAASAHRIKVLIAKVGLDSHYRGAIMVARYLTDRGMEVVYLGNQLPAGIAEAAVQEGADVVGVSCLSGNHNVMVPRIMHELLSRGGDDVLVLVGGVVPAADRDELLRSGVAAVFAVGSRLDDIARFIESNVRSTE